MIQAFFCLSAQIPEKCDIRHTSEKVLDLYTLLFVYCYVAPMWWRIVPSCTAY